MASLFFVVGMTYLDVGLASPSRSLGVVLGYPSNIIIIILFSSLVLAILPEVAVW